MSNKRAYVIESTIGLIKIGCSYNPPSRAAMVSAHSAVPARLVAILDGGHDLERLLHRRFARHRGHAEWFRVEGPVASFLADVRGKGLDRIVPWVELSAAPGNPRELDLRSRLSAAAKARWADPGFRERQLDAFRRRSVRRAALLARPAPAEVAAREVA